MKLVNMYYSITLWKDVKDNAEAMKQQQEIFALASKVGYGVLNFSMRPEQQAQPVEQYQDYVEQEGEAEQ